MEIYRRGLGWTWKRDLSLAAQIRLRGHES